MCNCIKEVNAKLAEHNSRLALGITFGGGNQRSTLLIQTVQIETGRGKKKAISALPSYCPFCGVSYAKAEGERA